MRKLQQSPPTSLDQRRRSAATRRRRCRCPGRAAGRRARRRYQRRLVPPPPWVICSGGLVTIGAAALRPLVNALGGRRPRCRRPRRHSRHHRRRRCYDSYIGGCHRRRPADAEPVGRRAAALGVVITVAVFAGDQRPRSTLATATADVADAAVVAVIA